jgi:hypothetical protein
VSDYSAWSVDGAETITCTDCDEVILLQDTDLEGILDRADKHECQEIGGGADSWHGTTGSPG